MSNLLISIFVLGCLVFASEGKQQKMSEKEMFGSKSLKCLVCQKMVGEFEHKISKVDKKKKISTGNFRIKSDGGKSETIIPYLRSEWHINEMIDSLCKEFEEYAQAKDKKTGDPTIIRIMTHEGGMNPEFGIVDIVPDEDLNTRLKFYCETIMEEQEEDIIELLSTERSDMELELCKKRSKLCENLSSQPERKEL